MKSIAIFFALLVAGCCVQAATNVTLAYRTIEMRTAKEQLRLQAATNAPQPLTFEDVINEGVFRALTATNELDLAAPPAKTNRVTMAWSAPKVKPGLTNLYHLRIDSITNFLARWVTNLSMARTGWDYYWRPETNLSLFATQATLVNVGPAKFWRMAVTNDHGL